MSKGKKMLDLDRSRTTLGGSLLARCLALVCVVGSGALGCGGDGSGDGDGDGATDLNDVCAFSGATDLGEPDTEGLRSVPVDHPDLWYMGRIDCAAEGGPRFGFPGVSIRTKFIGTELRATFNDSGRGTATTTNFLDVTVDGGAPEVIELVSGVHEYVLASDLSEGEHEVLIWKRTEASPGGSANAGTVQVQGFRLGGDALLPVQRPERRLEFIGDSITCGYGNGISTTDPDNAPFTTENENNHLAYGAVTAELLGADYMGVSYSGKGMSRNYNGAGGETVPQFYLDILPDDAGAPAWNPKRFVADAVVINVGTNDFSTAGFDTELFTETYTAFLTTLRGYYPKSLLVTAIGPMLSDYYPPGAMAWTNAQQGMADAVAARKAKGDSNIRTVTFAPQTSPYGEDWHPTAETHASMAAQLAEVLREELGW